MQLPNATAMADEDTAIIVEFQNLFRNSSRTVFSAKIVLGDNPRDFSPSHLGVKSHHGTIFPFMTSGAALNVVVMVQYIGKRQAKAQTIKMLYINTLLNIQLGLKDKSDWVS